MAAARTVLVTGATGFIGRVTVRALADAGWTIIVGTRGNGSAAQGSVYLDLADPASSLALIEEQRCDAIVHLGAHVGWPAANAAAMFAPNVLSTGCLAHAANAWGAHLVYASAAVVHGARSEKIEPGSPLCPDTDYAKSKWLGEQMLAASGARHCILRIAGVFGAHGPAHLGLNRAISGVLEGEPPVQVGAGAALRNYVYVKDVAQAIVHSVQERLTGTHLLAGHEILSIRELLEQLCDTLAPGLQPVVTQGAEALDQIVTPSAALPRTRAFHDALVDIRDGQRQ